MKLDKTSCWHQRVSLYIFWVQHWRSANLTTVFSVIAEFLCFRANLTTVFSAIAEFLCFQQRFTNLEVLFYRKLITASLKIIWHNSMISTNAKFKWQSTYVEYVMQTLFQDSLLANGMQKCLQPTQWISCSVLTSLSVLCALKVNVKKEWLIKSEMFPCVHCIRLV